MAERYRAIIDEGADDSVFDLVGSVDGWLAEAVARGSEADRADALYYRTVTLAQRARDPVVLVERERLLISNEGVPAEAGYRLARAGRLRDAVVAVETSRTILFGRLTGWLDPQVRDAVPGGLLCRYVAALAALGDRYRLQYAGGAEPAAAITVGDRSYRTGHTTSLQTAAAEVDRLQKEIEDITGHRLRSLEPVTYGHVQQARAAAGVSLIYLGAAEESGYALIVSGSGEPRHVPLPEFTAEAAGARVALVQDGTASSKDLQEAVAGAVRWLAEVALTPLAGWTGPIGLVPIGITGALPIAAAMLRNGGPAVWHLPHARALTQASPPPAGTVRVCAAPEAKGYLPLPRTGRDIDWLERRYAGHIRSERRATIEDAVGALRDGDVVELLCHGRSDPVNPLESALILSDGHLTVRSLLSEGRCGTRLAILAACQTQTFDLRMSDEIIGLPLALHQAGVGAVIAAQWPVDDIATGLLLRRVHDALAAGSDPARALAEAQDWLRTATRQKLHDTYRDGYRMIGGDPSRRPFEHPVSWAGFTCSGYLPPDHPAPDYLATGS